jgi:hypothetical protein
MTRYTTPPSALLWGSLWLPRDYDNVTTHLPARIHELWTGTAPLEQFRAVLEDLVRTHRRICTAFTAWKASQPAQLDNPVMVTQSTFTVDADGWHTCVECGHRFATAVAWRVHIARRRCAEPPSQCQLGKPQQTKSDSGYKFLCDAKDEAECLARICEYEARGIHAVCTAEGSGWKIWEVR